MYRNSYFLMLLILLASASSHAALAERDLYNMGDGLITYDTLSGHEWLDLTETVNLSAGEIFYDGVGGWMDAGFRWATQDEVIDLFFAAGAEVPFSPASSQNYQAAYNLVHLLGKTYVSIIDGAEIAAASRGITWILNSTITQWSTVGYYSLDEKGRFKPYDGGALWNSKHHDVGHYLIRESSQAISEPALPTLLGFGLASLGFVRKNYSRIRRWR